MKIVILSTISLIMVIMVVWFIGSRLPRQHEVVLSVNLNADIQAVWHLLNDFKAYPEWRPSVVRVQRLSDHQGKEVWQESDRHGHDVAYATMESIFNERIIRRIVTPGLPYGGQWILALSPTSSGCSLSITEQGEIYNPMFKIMSKYVFGYDASIKRFIADVKSRLAAT